MLTCTEEMRNEHKILVGKCEKKYHVGDLGTDKRMIFKTDLKK
jgi:hypothetical protein